MTRGRRLLSQVRLAAQRPDLLLRKASGRDVSEISLDEIAGHLPDRPIILEAGAADGTDTARFVDRWPGCEVHAFEPVPAAFAKLEERTKGLPGVHRYRAALAAQSGVATMHVGGHEAGAGGSDSSSLLTPTGHLDEFPGIRFDEQIEIQTTTLDEWFAEAGLERIDLMWLDMQGAELAALSSGLTALAATRAVMLEVSRRELFAGTPLYPEVMSWMRAQGFRPAVDRVAVAFGNVLFVRA